MALLYRAVWEDDRPDLIVAVGDMFMSWVAEKDDSPGKSSPFEWEPIDAEDLSGAVGTLKEATPTGDWRTIIRVAIDAAERSQWVSVDVERTTDDAFTRVQIAAPRLVRTLISQSVAANGNPRVGPVGLSEDAEGLTSADDVTARILPLIEHADRRTPLVFFSYDGREAPGLTADRAHAAAEQLAGVARVYLLAKEAQSAFHDELGSELSVWGGGARMYLPGSLDPWRHRYLPWYVVQRHRREAGRRFAQMLRSFSPATRLPAPLDHLDRRLLTTETLSLEERITDNEREIQNLRDELDHAESERLDALQLAQDTESEKAALRLQLLSHFSASDSSGRLQETFEWPEEIASFKELVDAACKHLGHLSIPGSAPREFDRLDDALEAPVWAQKAWDGLRALETYAASGEPGGFVTWCQKGTSPYTWPATKARLSLGESDTVMGNPKLRQTREFEFVGAEGKVSKKIMQAHLKIAQGGGQNIPRIYFDDDTAGPTGKIHIGFIGPHDLVPNKGRS